MKNSFRCGNRTDGRVQIMPMTSQEPITRRSVPLPQNPAWGTDTGPDRNRESRSSQRHGFSSPDDTDEAIKQPVAVTGDVQRVGCLCPAVCHFADQIRPTRRLVCIRIAAIYGPLGPSWVPPCWRCRHCRASVVTALDAVATERI